MPAPRRVRVQGTIVQINISPGGLPKRAVSGGFIASLGIEGDRQAHPGIHGGPRQAILLIAAEVVDDLAARGYPVFYGALGENLTMRGIDVRHDGWAELVNDEEHGRCLIPMKMLCHEHDPDPAMRPKPISPEKREEVIVLMAAGLLGAYRYFREHREAYSDTTFSPERRRDVSKTGRNDPCPCGSGKKYKRCCGGATVN